jgi:hypothetical protein
LPLRGFDKLESKGGLEESLFVSLLRSEFPKDAEEDEVARGSEELGVFEGRMVPAR